VKQKTTHRAPPITSRRQWGARKKSNGEKEKENGGRGAEGHNPAPHNKHQPLTGVKPLTIKGKTRKPVTGTTRSKKHGSNSLRGKGGKKPLYGKGQNNQARSTERKRKAPRKAKNGAQESAGDREKTILQTGSRKFKTRLKVPKKERLGGTAKPRKSTSEAEETISILGGRPENGGKRGGGYKLNSQRLENFHQSTARIGPQGKSHNFILRLQGPDQEVTRQSKGKRSKVLARGEPPLRAQKPTR